jgi:HPt (histidine-containing phosphotransfer) domain-containing protein
MKTDLSYLEAMTEGDKGLIKELIGIFSTQVKEYSTLMHKYLGEKNWGELSKLAHKARSTVAIMGMKELSEELKQLELLTLKKEKTESYAAYVDHFNRECTEAVSELRFYK